MNKKKLTDSLNIRFAAPGDIPEIVKIENEAYPDPWTPKMFYKELQLEFSYFFVVTLFSKIVGYVVFWCIDDEIHLTNFTVSKNYRRQGFGKTMLKYVIDFVKSFNIKKNGKIYLEVRDTNLPAITLYKNFGFKKICIRKKYYSNTDDAVIMAKII
ncbi:MAG: ribosomal protein S18-alanine N-acetyltransferase [Elusimicrobiota bacterium]